MRGRKEPNPIWWDLKAIVEFGFYPKSNGKILMGSWKFLLQIFQPIKRVCLRDM